MLFRYIQADSSQRLPRWEANICLKSSVIIELIKQYPLHGMVARTIHLTHPCEGNDFDVAPTFPSGISGLYDYLSQRMDYSVVGQSDVFGTVLLEFTIETDGSVTSPEIKINLFPALDEQAMRIVSEMPRWSPAFKDGHPMRCRYQMPMFYFLGY